MLDWQRWADRYRDKAVQRLRITRDWAPTLAERFRTGVLDGAREPEADASARAAEYVTQEQETDRRNGYSRSDWSVLGPMITSAYLAGVDAAGHGLTGDDPGAWYAASDAWTLRASTLAHVERLIVSSGTMRAASRDLWLGITRYARTLPVGTARASLADYPADVRDSLRVEFIMIERGDGVPRVRVTRSPEDVITVHLPGVLEFGDSVADDARGMVTHYLMASRLAAVRRAAYLSRRRAQVAGRADAMARDARAAYAAGLVGDPYPRATVERVRTVEAAALRLMYDAGQAFRVGGR